MAAGYSQTVTPSLFGSGVQIKANQVDGGAIRSYTIGNFTSATTVVVYTGTNGYNGTPAIFAVQPGNVMTMPCSVYDGLSFVFVVKAGAGADGSVTIHVDSTPQAAAGFQVPTQATEWVWDSSAWDGGAVWGA